MKKVNGEEEKDGGAKRMTDSEEAAGDDSWMDDQ